ncbi:auxin-responsive protein SAUR71-like [Coffea eugenioides]|uniref:auxin-responsive protein SAUR71-like n=1 Tax=Coffea eugenioides TaxID=49369 RepID=UPI000F60EC4A|nr:auxin-responsive protein SAUR71-like [Coffea eugenioides]
MKGRDKSSSNTCRRLRSTNEAKIEGSVRKGQVPVLVGTNNETMERLAIPIRLINHPSLAHLLDESAAELGYNQQGLLRILCDVEEFKEVLDRIYQCGCRSSPSMHM